MEEYIIIKYEWLKLQDYQLRILILIKMLAIDREQITYTGTLKDMTKWLNLGNSAKNNKLIRNAIKELSEQGVIDYTPKSETAKKYTITIIDKPTNDVLSIDRKVDKQDIETIRNYVIDNNKRIMGNMLKIYIFALGNSETITYDNLGLLLNIITGEDIDKNGEYRTNKVSNAINTLEQCKFKDNTYFNKQRKYFFDSTENKVKGIGTLLTVNKQFK